MRLGHPYHDNRTLTICLDRDNVLPVTAGNETKKMTKTRRPTRHTQTNENAAILLKINETVHAHSTLLEWLAERLKRSAE
jgi:hypothetical protein